MVVFASATFAANSSDYSYDSINRLTNVTYALGASQRFTYDPAGNRTLRISTNPLTISAISGQVTVSGTPTATLPFAVNNPNVSAASLTVWGKSSNPSLVPKSALAFGGSGSNRTLAVTPVSGQTGTATITIVVSDGSVSAATSFLLTVNSPANQAPSFVKGQDQLVAQNSNLRSVAGWATAISPGPANESSQAVDFLITSNDNSALFSLQPSISSVGTLIFMPAQFKRGIASIQAKLHDNGGTANGGQDTSAAQPQKPLVSRSLSKLAASPIAISC